MLQQSIRKNQLKTVDDEQTKEGVVMSVAVGAHVCLLASNSRENVLNEKTTDSNQTRKSGTRRQLNRTKY